MIFLVQFGINKHLLIFFQRPQVARARRASAILLVWKNLLVLIYSKLHEKNHVITRNVFRFDEVLTLETSALKLFTVANLRYQLGC